MKQHKKHSKYNYIYYPQTRRYTLLGIWQMDVGKISLRMTICYYPSCKHSHSSLAKYTPIELPDTACAVVKPMPVAV